MKINKNNLIKFSSIGFILSNIGAAVGLGNIWRFPQEVVKNGGGAFVFAYFIVLFAIAFPVILLEVNYGLFFRRGSIGSFHKSNSKFGLFVGWKQTLLTSFLCIYYLTIMAWIFIAFILSFIPSFFESWSQDSNWFESNVLLNKASDGIKIDTTSISDFNFSPYVFGAFFIILLSVVLILFLGVTKGLEKANYFFVPGFFVMIFILMFYALSRNEWKAGELGVKVLFSFDHRHLQQFNIWFNASKQAIFSTGIMFGTIIVFAKSADIKMDKGNEAFIIIFADTFIALIAGIFISSLVASDAYTQNIDGIKTANFPEQVDILRNEFTENNPNLKGPGLLFVYLPTLFSSINANPYYFGWGNVLMIIFTLTLLFAALSSIIGLFEVLIDGLTENLLIKRKISVLMMFIFTFSLSFLYSTSFGSDLVDRQDSLVLVLIILMGFLEVAIFIFNSKYREIFKIHDQYSYLKTKFLNWHWWTCALVTLPVLLILFIFGFIEFFGFGFLINETGKFGNIFSESKKFILDIPQIISFTMYGGLLFFTFFFTFLSKKISYKNIK